ncbi:MAG TPA: sensor domain-containing phosphodiesterase, partial [Acidimicrobiales bacterium]|nr:sensor domain-containing phosphodiesterase [Acidimicrobiales bacterium]
APVSPRGWLGIFLASVTLDFATSVGVTGVMTVSAGFPGRDFLKKAAVQLALLPLIDFAMVVVAVACFWTQPWALLVLLGPALVLGWWYSASEKMRSHFSDLQSLYGFSRALADVSERTDVLAVALKETRTVLRCDSAELCVAQPEGLIRYRLDLNEQVVEDLVELPGPEQTALETQQPVLIPAKSKDGYLAQRALKDAMAVPLSIGGSRSAVLVVTDRHGSESNTFATEDLDFLQALAAHLSTALTSSEHLDDLRRSVAEREHQAFHVGLTGLANRTLFMNVVAAALENSAGSRMVAVVLMDLDGFKEINDALGHHTGDAVLRVMATRVSAGVREFGMAARLGGDEFAFLVPSASSLDEVTAITERLMDSVGAPMEIDSVALTVRASVGISLAPVHGLDAATLLKKADVAMYGAKSSSRRITVYDQSMDNSSARRLALATDLGRAIDSDELDLWFQPVADMASGRISGFEALLRWPHPALGFVPPDEFIPIAEQTGLIEPLTWWVMRRALSEQRRWRDEGYEFTMAVNMSVRTLLDPGIVERLGAAVAEYGLTPTNLTLEITESSMMVELERSEAVLRRLSDMGFKIAIDDFGTGYSSLSRLKVLPVHVVKVDRAFVKNICADKGDQAIVRSIIELAGVMGHTVVAEGIEDLQTWSRLASLGCDLGQGYYFARPMLATDCRQWVLERQAPSVASVRPLTIKRFGGA